MVTDSTKLKKLKAQLKNAGLTVQRDGSIKKLVKVTNATSATKPPEEEDNGIDTENNGSGSQAGEDDNGASDDDRDSDGLDDEYEDDDSSDDDDDHVPSATETTLTSKRKRKSTRTLPTHENVSANNENVSANNNKTNKSPAIDALEEAERKIAKKDKAKGDPMEDLIYDTIKEDLFRSVKFAVGPEQRKEVTSLCLMKMNLEDFEGKSEAKIKLRNRWIKANEGTVIKKLNKVRNYAGTQSRKAAWLWMNQKKGQLPSLECLEKCLKRDLDMDDKDDYELFKWHVDELIPAACGHHSHWNPEKRYYLLMSTAAPPNKPTSKYITTKTEAMAVCYVENFRSKWTEIWKLQQKSELAGVTKFQALHKTVYASDGTSLAYDYEIDSTDKKRVNLNGPKWLGKHTEVDMGPGKDSGWNKEGRQDFVKWTKMNKAARSDPKCQQVEQAYLTKLKAELGIVSATAAEERARKRRKKPKKACKPEDNVAMEHDSE